MEGANIDLERHRLLAASRAKENRKFLNSLKKADTRKLDGAVHQLHEEVFATTDCLECANCCKTTSPIFYQNDIERLSRHFRIRPSAFIEKYLRIDEDGDYVLIASPCPFLLPDNHCSVYEARPRACREYPHTDRKKMVQVLDLAYRNTHVCPAVLEIVERLKSVPL
ncbi:MAG: YkgJ family cysteine cluster protein [Bacteroidota bacterium]